MDLEGLPGDSCSRGNLKSTGGAISHLKLFSGCSASLRKELCPEYSSPCPKPKFWQTGCLELTAEEKRHGKQTSLEGELWTFPTWKRAGLGVGPLPVFQMKSKMECISCHQTPSVVPVVVVSSWGSTDIENALNSELRTRRRRWTAVGTGVRCHPHGSSGH